MLSDDISANARKHPLGQGMEDVEISDDIW